MTRAANATYPMKLACLIWLAAENGHPFICRICGKPILPGQAVQYDHGHAVGRGGANTFKDIRPVHAEKRATEDGQGNRIDCHDQKTFRPRGGATTLGGDNYEAKKTNRMAEATAGNAPPTGRRMQGRPFPPPGSRPMRSGRKLQSRPFPKRPEART
jgi:hypothetical protein